ncbi:hypothetical protein RIF29_14395 [Crotalaria pallida]|uniref:Uncharacterized protein n=1 Tax=Crotalaria pallida TaxID=3830 RepID=A0AAN9FFA0_CROPI
MILAADHLGTSGGGSGFEEEENGFEEGSGFEEEENGFEEEENGFEEGSGFEEEKNGFEEERVRGRQWLMRKSGDGE